MQDGSHAEIDFDFYVNGELFSMLYYLVDGIYPSLARFLASIPDPHSKIDRCFFPVSRNRTERILNELLMFSRLSS
jgi:hypothetical protein